MFYENKVRARGGICDCICFRYVFDEVISDASMKKMTEYLLKYQNSNRRFYTHPDMCDWGWPSYHLLSVYRKTIIAAAIFPFPMVHWDEL